VPPARHLARARFLLHRDARVAGVIETIRAHESGCIALRAQDLAALHARRVSAAATAMYDALPRSLSARARARLSESLKAYGLGVVARAVEADRAAYVSVRAASQTHAALDALTLRAAAAFASAPPAAWAPCGGATIAAGVVLHVPPRPGHPARNGPYALRSFSAERDAVVAAPRGSWLSAYCDALQGCEREATRDVSDSLCGWVEGTAKGDLVTSPLVNAATVKLRARRLELFGFFSAAATEELIVDACACE
jgi:hypothetical protein